MPVLVPVLVPVLDNNINNPFRPHNQSLAPRPACPPEIASVVIVEEHRLRAKKRPHTLAPEVPVLLSIPNTRPMAFIPVALVQSCNKNMVTSAPTPIRDRDRRCLPRQIRETQHRLVGMELLLDRILLVEPEIISVQGHRDMEMQDQSMGMGMGRPRRHPHLFRVRCMPVRDMPIQRWE